MRNDFSDIDVSAIPGLGFSQEEMAKINIEQYFARDEFDAMPEYEKSRLRKIKQNYHAMLHFGLKISKPWFMKNKADKMKDAKHRSQHMGEEDREWRPTFGGNSQSSTQTCRKSATTKRGHDSNQSQRNVSGSKGDNPTDCIKIHQENKRVNETQRSGSGDEESRKPFHGLTKQEIRYRVNQLQIKIQQKRDSLKNLVNASKLNFDMVTQELKDPTAIKTIKKYAAMKDKADIREQGRIRYPKRNIPRGCYADLEAPDDDRFVYCEACNRDYDDECIIHGSLTIIKDREVPRDGTDPKRAYNTLPGGFAIRKSSIPGAGKGVWTTSTLQSGVRLGPYEGEVELDRDIAHESGYSWEIYKDGKPLHYIDAGDESKSNWMCFVNCACREEDQNLVAFQYDGEIYYRPLFEIPANTELLVWYGHEYGTELGLVHETSVSECVSDPAIHQTRFEIQQPHPQENTGLKTSVAFSICEDMDSSSVTTSSIHYEDKQMECKCPICNKDFIDLRKLQNHLQSHTLIQPYKCPICDERFTMPIDLRIHFASHTDEMNLSESRFDEGMHGTFKGERPHECIICGKKVQPS